MYRLLLPGIQIKRWMLVSLSGMVLFALGFTLLVRPQYRLESLTWRLWMRLTHSEMPDAILNIGGIALLLLGTVLVTYSIRRLIRALMVVANPSATGKQLLMALVEKHRSAPKLHVVGIGGGTGLSTLLRGLKEYSLDITAIVTVSDDGGSSGRLRADLDMPPPGDIRHCLVALAEAEPLMEQLFQHRFVVDSQDLDGHSLGNLIIAGMREITGDFQAAIKEVSRVLAVRGRVLPSANRALVLKATMADGSVVEGETAIVSHGSPIVSISLDPPDVPALPEALQAIRDADIIIVGPGSVYSSLLPNLIVPGMAEALSKSQALKFFVCNVMTQPGESDDFSASRHMEVVLSHLPCENPFHYTVVNLEEPPAHVASLYAEKEQRFVHPDLARFRELGTIPVTGNLLARTHLARHDPDKLARCILERVAQDTNWPDLLRRKGV